MAFKHEEIAFEELSAEIVEGVGRVYTTPSGAKYPSVTTVIGAVSDKSWLDAWKKRVGEEQAEKIKAQAGRRGTAVHELAEQYLRNNRNYKSGHMPGNIETFSKMKPFLDKHVGKIYGLEVPLYSDKLKTAGRVDVLAEWNKILSIVDFKTSRSVKTRDDIHDYFIQESAYAFMVFERTGLLPKQLVTVMAVDDNKPLLFIEKTRDWIEKFIDVRNRVDF